MTSKVALVLVALAVSAILFVALNGSDEDSAADSDSPSVGQSDSAAVGNGSGEAPGHGRDSPVLGKPGPEPGDLPEIVIEAGAPVGGIAELEFKSGETIEFTVSSKDTTDEVHFHGYEIEQQLTSGDSTTFKVAATIEGVFEVELHHSLAQIAEISVVP